MLKTLIPVVISILLLNLQAVVAQGDVTFVIDDLLRRRARKAPIKSNRSGETHRSF